jgi:hypothetical protein
LAQRIDKEGLFQMMKFFFAVMGCFAVLTVSAADAKVSSGKRHMEGANAVKTYQKELRSGKLPDTSEELTREFFAKNYKAVFASYFGKNEAGEVVRTKKFNEETGKVEQLVGKDVKLTPAPVKEAWESLEAGETLLVRTNLMEQCGFCDGSRYVFYFNEEVKELVAYKSKYHRQHAVKEEDDDDDKKNRNRDTYDNDRNNDKEDKAQRKRERKEQEYADLCSRAEDYGWTEVAEEVRKAILGNKEWKRKLSMTEDSDMKPLSCCWTAIHEDKTQRFRHMCSICKGKVKMKTPRMRLFEVSK